MAQIGIAQSTPDQKPAAPAPATPPATTTAPASTTAPDNTAAPEQPEKTGILHKLNPLHRHGGKAKAEKPPKPAKPAAAEKAASASENPESTGPTAFVQVEGNHFNMGTVLTYDFNVGYRWSKHVSTDIGLPIVSTRTPFSIVSKVDWRDTTVIGTPYIDVRYDTKRGSTNITSILTGAAGFNMVKTYSNGRMTADWFNHFDRNYQILNYDAIFTPFLNFGGGTGTVDRQVMPRPYELARPYETLGLIANGEAGGAFTIKKIFRLEGSAYGLAPVGPQKVYSRLVSPDNLLGGDGHHNRFWDEFFETGGEYVNTYGSGPSRIARDNGYGVYLTISKFKNVDFMLGYTMSVHYDYGSSFIMLRYNFTGLLRNLTVGERGRRDGFTPPSHVADNREMAG